MIPPPPGLDPDQYRRLSPRWAGSAMNACPEDVPWQRVINSQGMISLPPGSATPYAHQQQATAWMSRRPGDGEMVEALGYRIRLVGMAQNAAVAVFALLLDLTGSATAVAWSSCLRT